MATIFFSYSHKDEAARNELEAHLAMLKNSGLVEVWHDRRILAGEPIDNAISANLEAADIILLLISADFLNSRYCYSLEMTRALERHESREAHVIPIILRDCDWHSAPFGHLMAAPKDGLPVAAWRDRDSALADVARQVRKVVEARQDGRESKAKPSLMPTPQHTPPGIVSTADASPATARPRSSNLRLKKDFTDQEKDAYQREAFHFIAGFFAESLAELHRRNPEVTGEVRWVTANEAVADLYRHGKRIEQCAIKLNGSAFGAGITYSNGTSLPLSSYNELLMVEATDQVLALRPLMGGHGTGTPNARLSQEQAAEHLWSMFLGRLQ